ncbi:MAG: hypothetical protein K6C68_00970 [Ruminococcus sp.]|nr:hypothetical protein [Ruminococcus sp.]
MAHKDHRPNRDFLRQLIRALIVLALAVAVLIISSSEKAVRKIKKTIGLQQAAAVSVSAEI